MSKALNHTCFVNKLGRQCILLDQPGFCYKKMIPIPTVGNPVSAPGGVGGDVSLVAFDLDSALPTSLLLTRGD